MPLATTIRNRLRAIRCAVLRSGHFLLPIIPPICLLVVGFALFSYLGSGHHVLDAFCWPSVERAIREAGAGHADKLCRVNTNVNSTLGKYAIYYVLLAPVVVMVFMNTILYANEVVKAADTSIPTTSGGITKSARFRRICQLGLLLAASVNGTWMVFVPLIPAGGHFHELMAFALFTMFLGLDLLMYRSYLLEAQHCASDEHSRERFLKQADYFKKQCAYVDLPVVIGLLVVGLFVVGVGHFFQIEEQFFMAFVSGATLMHLVTSQIIFLIITVAELRDR
jgi:hypothetical protein